MANDQVAGSRLASTRPAINTDTLAFTASMATEITRGFVVNVDSSAHTFRIYHVPAGGSPGSDNAIYWDKTVAANDTFDLQTSGGNSGIHMAENDMIYVRSNSAALVSFQIYGVTTSIAPEKL